MTDGGPPVAPEWAARTRALRFTRRAAEPVRAVLQPPRRRAVLAALVAQTSPDGPADLDAMVRTLALGRPLTRLPRLPRRTLSRGVELLIDEAEWLAPFRSDAQALAQALRQLLPSGSLAVRALHGGPPPRGEGRAAAQALPGSLVLVAGDAGAGWRYLGRPPAGAAEWLGFAASLRAQGRALRILSPLPPERLPAALRRKVPVLHWSEHTSAAQVQRTVRTPGSAAPAALPALAEALTPVQWRERCALDLATVLAPALRVDLALLRRARRELLPALAPEAEHDLWFGNLVATRGAGGITFKAAAQARLAERLQAGLPLPAARVLAWHKRLRRRYTRSRRLEDALQRLTLAGHGDNLQAIEGLLRPAFKALAEGGAAADAVAAWVPQAWGRMPPAVRGSAPAQRLALAAALHLRGSGWRPAAGEAPMGEADAAALAWLLPEQARQLDDWTVELRGHTDGERVARFSQGAGEPSQARHRVQAPAGDPPWIGLQAGSGTGAPAALHWRPLVSGAEFALPADGAPLRWCWADGRRQALAPVGLLEGLHPALLQGSVANRPVAGLALGDDLALLVLQGVTWPEHTQAVNLQDAHGRAIEGPVRRLGALSLPWPLPGASLEVLRTAPARLTPLARDEAAPVASAEPGLLCFDGEAWRALDAGGRDAAPGPGQWLLQLAGGGEAASQLVLPEAGADWKELAARGKASSVAPQPLPRSLPLQSLREAALALRARDWVCRVAVGEAVGKAAGESQWRMAWAVADGLKRVLGADRVIAPDAPGSPSSVSELAADVLFLLGADLPDAATQAWLASDAPFVWAPLVANPLHAVRNWPEPLRQRLLQRQTLAVAERDQVDPDTLVREFAQWSPLAGPPGAESDGAAVPAPAVARGGWSLGGVWQSLTGTARRVVVQAMEQAIEPGLSRVPLRGAWAPEPLPHDVTDFDRERPVLLLLPGLMATAEASFGALWQPDAADDLAQLAARYEVAYAWDWRALATPPLESLRLLLMRLNGAQRVHVVGLSVGGLLGELMAAVTADLAVLRSMQAQVPEAESLEPVRLFARLQVEQLVRVGAPMRGLGVMARSLGRMAGLGRAVGMVLPGGGGVGVLSDQVAQLSHDAAAAPGLTALMPEAALMRWLADPALPPLPAAGARLSIVAGEHQAAGLMGRLQAGLMGVLAPAGERSDTLVPLADQFAGLPRSGGFDYLVAQGPGATHFRYFAEPATRGAVVEALLGQPAQRLRHADSYAQALQQLGLAPLPA